MSRDNCGLFEDASVDSSQFEGQRRGQAPVDNGHQHQTRQSPAPTRQGNSQPVQTRPGNIQIEPIRRMNYHLEQPIQGNSQPGQPIQGNSQPGQTRQGNSQPGQTRQGNSQPGQTRQGNSQPGQPIQGNSQPGQTRQGNSQPGQTRQGNSQPGQTRQGNSQPGQTRQGNSQPGQTRMNKKPAIDARSVDSGYSESSAISQSLEYLTEANPESLESQLSNTLTYRGDSDVISSVSHNVLNLVGGKSHSVSSSFSSTSCCSQNEDTTSMASLSSSLIQESYTDEEVEEYLWKMPYDLREEYHDGMILYSDLDEEQVSEFHSSLLRNIVLKDKKPPKVILSDEIAREVASRITTLEFGLERCTYVFIYLTANFIKDTWAEFSGQTCLMEAIQNPQKRWCVVPVFTQPKRNSTFTVPPSINSLKGVQYWSGASDKFYNDSVKKLLNEKLNVRKLNQANLRKKQRKWLKEFKIKEYFEKVKEEEEERLSEEKHQRLIMEHQQRLQQKQSMPPEMPYYPSNHPVKETQQPSEEMQQQVLLNSPSYRGSLAPMQEKAAPSYVYANVNQQPESLDSNVDVDADPQSSRFTSVNSSPRTQTSSNVNYVPPQKSLKTDTMYPSVVPNMPQEVTGDLLEQRRTIQGGEKLSGYPNTQLNRTGSQPDQRQMTQNRESVGGYPPYTSQNITQKFPDRGQDWNVSMQSCYDEEQNYASYPMTVGGSITPQIPQQIQQMNPETHYINENLMWPRETMHDITEIKHVHYHTHIYPPPPPSEPRPLNIINPKIVQIGQSNIVSGHVDGIDSGEDADSDENQPESSLIEESDRGIYSNPARQTPDFQVPYLPDQSTHSRMSQDNLPSNSTSDRREATYQDQTGMHSTQVKCVEELHKQHSKKKPTYSKMGLKDSDTSIFHTMQNPSLHALPRPTLAVSPKQTAVVKPRQSSGGTNAVQNAEGSNPIQYVSSAGQNIGRCSSTQNIVPGCMESNRAPMENQEFEQTATKSVVDDIPSIERAMRDVVIEQTLKKHLDDPYETELHLPDDDSSDPRDQTLLKQHHVSPAFTSVKLDHETLNKYFSSLSLPYATSCQTDIMRCNMSERLELKNSTPDRDMDLPISQNTENNCCCDKCTRGTVLVEDGRPS